MTIEHHHDQKQFACQTPHGLALLQYLVRAQMLEIHHVYVPPPDRGSGLAGQLMQAALGWAQTQQLRVQATCPYAAVYLQRHPEYHHLSYR